MSILPNESYPVPDVLWCMTHAQRKHDSGLWADPCHTWGKLSRWTCRRHDGWQGAAEQRASCLYQLWLVLITPLLVHRQTGRKKETYSQRVKKRPEERENRQYPFEWTTRLADIGEKLSSRPVKVLFFHSLTNWFGRASGAELIKRRCRPGYAVELALFEKHSMQ